MIAEILLLVRSINHRMTAIEGAHAQLIHAARGTLETGTSQLHAAVAAAASPDLTTVTGQNGLIIDHAGNSWRISLDRRVIVNGIIDTTTRGVEELAWVNGVVWQQNDAGKWWGKTSPAATWTPPQGTTTGPM
jgi:hypothetical protein